MSKWPRTDGDSFEIKTVGPRSGARAMLVSGVIATLAVLLGACGGASDPQPTRSTTGAKVIAPMAKVQAPAPSQHLCQAVGNLDHLVVSRSDAFPQNHIHFSFPGTVKVSSASQVRTVARAICTLPPVPKGPISCPLDLGIDYNLTFSAEDHSFAVVRVNATGCENVSGRGISTRWVVTSPGLWSTLGHAMGLAHPTNATFRGSLPT